MEDFEALFKAAEELTKQAEEAYARAVTASPIEDLEKSAVILERVNQVSHNLVTHKQRLITHLVSVACTLDESRRSFKGSGWSVWYQHNCTNSHLTWKDHSGKGVFVRNLAYRGYDEIFWELAAALLTVVKAHVAEQLATRPSRLTKEVAAFTAFVTQLQAEPVPTAS